MLRSHGGVAMYVINEVAADSKVVLSGSNGVIEYLMLFIRKYNLIVVTVYRPPDANYSEFIPVIANIKENVLALGNTSPSLILCGDFNMPDTDWNNSVTVGGSLDHKRQASAMMELRDELFLNQIVDVPTRIDNVLDLVFVDDSRLIMNVEVTDTGMSDHRLIKIDSMLTFPKISIESRSLNGLHALNFYSNKTRWNNIVEELSEIDWQGEFAMINVVSMYDYMMEKLYTIARKYTPKKMSRPTKSSIPRDRKVLMRKRSRISKSLARDIPNRGVLEERVRVLNEQLQQSHREELQREEEAAVQAIKSNAKYFFKYCRNKSEIRTAIGPLRSGDSLVGDPVQMSEILRRQYESVFSVPNNNSDITASSSGSSQNEEIEMRFGPTDFVEATRDLRPNSAPGPDGVPAILLTNTIEILCIPLNLLWQESLRTGVIPQSLKLGKVTPIFKGGDRSIPKNYKPVSNIHDTL